MTFGDKIWYGDGREEWVVDKNTIYNTCPLSSEQQNKTLERFKKIYSAVKNETKKSPFDPKRILRSGPATIVFWEDGTKTVVKCAADENDNTYAAFTAALAIKIFGSNSAVKKLVKSKTEEAK